MSKKRKVHLISIHIKKSPQAMSLATLLLKAQLESVEVISKNVEVNCLEYYLNDFKLDVAPSNKKKEKQESIPANIVSKIANSIDSSSQLDQKSRDMIGFSTYIWNRQEVVSLSKQLKKRFPDFIFFAGGAEASADPISLLEDSCFDFVVKGEGELTLTQVMKELLLDKAVDRIPGVYTRHVQKYTAPFTVEKATDQNSDSSDRNTIKDAAFIENLDQIPSLFLNSYVDLKIQKGILWELSRGCSFRCTYCYEGLGIKTVRHFSLHRIQAELELFELYKVNQVFVLDPIFNHDPKRTKIILQLIKKIAPQIHFIFEIRTEYLSEEIISMFSEIHCTLQIGLESSNAVALKSVKRAFHPQKYADKIHLLNRYHISFGLDLIYGLPMDTFSGFMKSLNFAFELQPNHLDIFPLSVLPGTELNSDKGRYNLNVTSGAPYTLISSPTFSQRDMQRAAQISNGINLFYNRGMAVPWFFMVVETLKILPADFFAEFAKSLNSQYEIAKKVVKEADFSTKKILLLQMEFVQKQFQKRQKEKQFLILKDIIQYHFSFNSAMMVGPLAESLQEYGNPDDTMQGEIKVSNLQFADSVTIVELHYAIEDLMSVGEFTFDEFLGTFKPQKSTYIIYNFQGEVIVEHLPSFRLNFLKKFEKVNSVERVLSDKSYSNIKENEVYEFLQYCLQQHILYKV